MTIPSFDALNNLEQDQLDFDAGAENLAELLSNVELPNSFGIYGKWGSGKTTLLNFTKQIIDEHNDYDGIKTVFFNPWEYDPEDEVPSIFPLFHKIKKELNWYGDEQDIGKRLVPGAATVFSRMSTQNPSKIAENLDIVEEELHDRYEQWTGQRENLHSDFEAKIASLLDEQENDRLLIFVDDLDRCSQENAVEILEMIKNYLNVKKTLFIFGMDHRVMIDHINEKYPGDRSYGEEYLHKMIPFSYELPVPESDKIKRYMGNVLSLQENEIDDMLNILQDAFQNNYRLFKVVTNKFKLVLNNIDSESILQELAKREQTGKMGTPEEVRNALFRIIALQEKYPNITDEKNWIDKYYSDSSNYDLTGKERSTNAFLSYLLGPEAGKLACSLSSNQIDYFLKTVNRALLIKSV